MTDPQVLPEVIVGSLSPSRAADFKACPLLYRFRTIDRLDDVIALCLQPKLHELQQQGVIVADQNLCLRSTHLHCPTSTVTAPAQAIHGSASHRTQAMPTMSAQAFFEPLPGSGEHS